MNLPQLISAFQTELEYRRNKMEVSEGIHVLEREREHLNERVADAYDNLVKAWANQATPEQIAAYMEELEEEAERYGI